MMSLSCYNQNVSVQEKDEWILVSTILRLPRVAAYRFVGLPQVSPNKSEVGFMRSKIVRLFNAPRYYTDNMLEYYGTMKGSLGIQSEAHTFFPEHLDTTSLSPEVERRMHAGIAATGTHFQNGNTKLKLKW